MGYTHYYEQKGQSTPEQMALVVADCKTILEYAKKENIGVFGWDDEKQGFFGEPLITQKVIEINGDESKGLDYETFFFCPNDMRSRFCKTARLEYDTVVCSILISMTNRLNGFKFSSDGNMIDWIPVFDFYINSGLKLKKSKEKQIINWLNK